MMDCLLISFIVDVCYSVVESIVIIGLNMDLSNWFCSSFCRIMKPNEIIDVICVCEPSCHILLSVVVVKVELSVVHTGKLSSDVSEDPVCTVQVNLRILDWYWTSDVGWYSRFSAV